MRSQGERLTDTKVNRRLTLDVESHPIGLGGCLVCLAAISTTPSRAQRRITGRSDSLSNSLVASIYFVPRASRLFSHPLQLTASAVVAPSRLSRLPPSVKDIVRGHTLQTPSLDTTIHRTRDPRENREGAHKSAAQ